MAKWTDFLDIGPQCVEKFVDTGRVPELSISQVEIAGASCLTGKYRVGYANCDTHTVLFSVEGEGRIHSNAGSHIIATPSATIIPLNASFIFELHSSDWSIAWFRLKDCRRWDTLKAQHPFTKYCQQARQIFHLLSAVYYEQDVILRSQFCRLLDQLLGNSLTGQHKHNTMDVRLEGLFQRIEHTLHVNWTIEAMCLQVHLCASHLHRLCRARYGRSPLQQVIFLRMRRAQYLLRHSSWSISRIGEHVGYTNPFNFSKRFKKSLGVSPSDYRKGLELRQVTNP